MGGERGTSREIWRAPAKINLWLEITGRRPDGYHTVDTCYQAIDLADRVILGSADHAGVSCVVKGPFAAGVPEGPDNLAARAALLLAERTGHELRVTITVVKEIPAGAGLGGGSSDAAAVLVALGHRFAVPDPDDTLVELATELGADVPFFLKGGTQRATGIGDRLRPVDPPAERWGILVWPGVAVSTAWAYETYDRSREECGTRPKGVESPEAHAKERTNVLESLVCDAFPEIRRAVELLETGDAVRTAMTGSGSASFGLYSTEAGRDRDLVRVRERINELPGACVWPFTTVGHGVMRAAEVGWGARART